MKIELKRLIDALDSGCKSFLEASVKRCMDRGGLEILIEDLLFVMTQNEDTLFRHLLKQYHIDENEMTFSLQGAVSSLRSESSNPVFSSLLIQWLEDAFMYAKLELNVDEISEVALLLSLFEQSNKYSQTSYFQHFKDVSLDEAKSLIKGLHEEASHKVFKKSKNSDKKVESDLNKYTKDLTALAKEGGIDPVLCRDDEIKQAIDILCRRRKNNPIMVGEAGVGKTAVVEGLALRIASNDVPSVMKDAQILSLDLGALQAGASVKGEFERRLQSVIQEIQAQSHFMILFIDESHTLIGAGGNEGGSDAANLLKPALARGGLRTIAATTWHEYRKYFEKDPALSRRFQKINLLEPSIEDSVTILRGIASVYEEEHGVYIEDEAFKAAAELSARYISGRQLPDKAIDVIDTACANVKISHSNRPFMIQKIENEIETKQREYSYLKRDTLASVDDYTLSMHSIEEEIKELEEKVRVASLEWETQKSKIEEIQQMQKSEDVDSTALKAARQELANLQKEAKYVYENVTYDQVAEVISSWTGIPLGAMVQKQALGVMMLQDKMQQRIKGQESAIEQISDLLQVAMAGLKKRNAPSGVFLLAGPSGVGKTETALTIADMIYGGSKFLTTINMTEFQEKHTISRLIGAPPGYVGYGEGGQLTDPVRVSPYSVVLLDEIEKAHPDILNLFYQIFDKGIANDGEGREIDFSNCTFVLTTNLGAQEITRLCKEDQDVSSDMLTQAVTPILSDYLKPALLGRMNLIPYRNLSSDALADIIQLKLGFIKEQLDEKNILFDIDSSVIDYVSKRTQTLDAGARNIDSIINKNILPKLSKEILQGSIDQKEFEKISVCIENESEIMVRSL